MLSRKRIQLRSISQGYLPFGLVRRRAVLTLSRNLIVRLTVIALCSTLWAHAATISAHSCSRADVGDAVDTARDGDTVLIPAGTCSWTATLAIDKSIAVIGAGIDKTVLVDEVPRTNSLKRMFNLLTTAGKPMRLSGLTLRGGTVTEMNWDSAVMVGGTSKGWRVDHVKFYKLSASGLRTYGYTYGVIDHCVFDLDFKQGIIIWHDKFGGASFGDGSWAAPVEWGTPQAVYIEDNTFRNIGTAAAVDSMGGGRLVFRHNTVVDSTVGNHGTESTQRVRSARSYEIYGNTFSSSSNLFTAIFLRGGTGVIFDNTFNGYKAAITVANFRSNEPYKPWGQCDGTNVFDGNQLPNGYPCLDQVGRSTGDLLSGSNPITPSGWPHQELEPLYEWGNSLNGQTVGIAANNGDYIVAGRDFYDHVQKPGYTPYVYPHPLTSQSGDSASVRAPPSALRILGQ